MFQDLEIFAMAILALVAGILASVIIRNYWRKWILVPVKGDFTEEHHLPDRIPVPRQESHRVSNGEFSFDEAVAWMRQFVRERRFARSRREYELVFRKYELYRQLGEKMGRGLWQDVDRLGQRLAEIDPLDPSAAVARGRAMRALGNFPRAIRFYQQALDLTPFHSMAFPEMASTCRFIGQPGRFRTALERASHELGETHPLTLEARIQLGELVRIYADPTDPATVAHIPRDQYVQNVMARFEDMQLDRTEYLRTGQAMLADDMPELADALSDRCDREYGVCAESLLLRGMTEHYRMRDESAMNLIRESLEAEETGVAHQEFARVLIDQAHRADERKERERLLSQAHQELRIAIDRDHNMVDALAMLSEPKWEEGLAAVVASLEPIARNYPQSWAVWRVIGDAYETEEEHRKAIESYRRGIEIEMNDELLLPCLNSMEQLNLRHEMLELVSSVPRLQERDPQLRWKGSQVFCEHERFRLARRLLQSLVDDERVAPPLRQRADDVLDQLDDLERRRFKRKQRGTRRNKGRS